MEKSNSLYEKKQPVISIIVPVYKVERYLRRCLDSIIAQTFTDWECILIDDGSPDSSGKICDEYAAKDSRFRVIHQENKGVSAARNAGLDAARGEWIGFVDSDDWIETNMYETALRTATEIGADLLQWGICIENDKKVAKTFVLPQKSFSFEDCATYWTPSMCQKLVSKKLISDNAIRFLEGMALSEDMLFSAICYTKAKKCFYISKIFYHYYSRQGSASHCISKKMVEQEVKGIRLIEDILSSRQEYEIKDYILLQKIGAKKHAALCSDSDGFDFCRSVFPEIDDIIFTNKNKFVRLYFFIFHHFDFIAQVLIFTWKKIRGEKDAC